MVVLVDLLPEVGLVVAEVLVALFITLEYLSPGSYTVTVGAGERGVTSDPAGGPTYYTGNDGNDSSKRFWWWTTYTAYRGGGGQR